MRWITVLLAILFLGCSNNTKLPPDIIQRPRMEKILWEMVQADRFATSFIQSRKDTLGRNKTESIGAYDKVFSYNGITREDFLNSYNFYLGRPDLLKVMFDSISARAERKRSEVYNHPVSKPPNRNIKMDSLRNKADSIKHLKLKKPPSRLP
jgi:hypothetical protein